MSNHSDQLQPVSVASDLPARRRPNLLTKIREKNVFSLLTIASGAAALLLTALDKLPDAHLNKAILAILALLATSELVDRAHRLNTMEDAIRSQIDERLKVVAPLTAMTLNYAISGLQYLAICVERARKSVDLASLSPPITRPAKSSGQWEDALQRANINSQVTLRYIYNKQDAARQSRVDALKRMPNAANSYFKRFEHQGADLPLMNFLIIDDTEVVFILPTGTHQPESWVSVQSKDVIAAFQRHFDYLWARSIGA